MHAIILLVNLDSEMKLRIQKFIVICSVFAATMLLSEPAAAFRCGSKLVKDGMHELEVVKICGATYICSPPRLCGPERRHSRAPANGAGLDNFPLPRLSLLSG